MGMAHGYTGMASFVSLQMGLVWVIGCVILFTGAYIVGATKGGRAAAKYTALTTWFFLIGFVAIVSYAYVIGEARRFLEDYPYTVAIEMFLLALGCVWIMWFMATQYSRGRIAIDERFGSKENYLRAKEAAKNASKSTLQQSAGLDAAAPAATDAATFAAGAEAIPAADMTNVMPAVDPNTGLAAHPTNAAAAPTIDPTTGAPMMIDPQTGQPMPAPQAAAAPVPGGVAPQAPALDPATGMPFNPAASPALAAVPPVDLYAVHNAAVGSGQLAGIPDFAAPGAVPQAGPEASSSADMFAPLPLGPSAPNVMPESNEQWLQQLAPSPNEAQPFAQAPGQAAQAQPMAGHSPAIDPYTGQPMAQGMPASAPQAGQFDPFAQAGQVPGAPQTAPAIDPFTGQAVAQTPPPAPAAQGAFDPFAQAPGQVAQAQPMAGHPPAIDPYTGQPMAQGMPASAPQAGQVPPPAAPGNPYGY